MPEYLAPGVFVEEVSFRSKSIEGVSTTTTAFVGPTRYGPLDIEPDVVTSLSEYEWVYGGADQLELGASSTKVHNYMWHAVRAFFENGGKRLYIARTYTPRTGTTGQARVVVPDTVTEPEGPGGALDTSLTLYVHARFPGAAGNGTLLVSPVIGANALTGLDGNGAPILTGPPVSVRFNGLASGDRVLLVYGANVALATVAVSDGGAVSFALAERLRGTDLLPTANTGISGVYPVLLNLTWRSPGGDPNRSWSGIRPADVTEYFSVSPPTLGLQRTLPIVVRRMSDAWLAAGPLSGLLPSSANDPVTGASLSKAAALKAPTSVSLSAGTDGDLPTASAYEGRAELDSSARSGLKALEDIEDISIVAAPGLTASVPTALASAAEAMIRALSVSGNLISHCERMRYRIAVLDSVEGHSIADVRAFRARFDSKYAALYYPWVRILDPVTRKEVNMPPSGFISGIYARNDVQRAVFKAPANEVVQLALGFEQTINTAQQEVLNPEGINCLRFFEGRGLRVWGARTMSSDPEWKYVNVRRYFIYLERSIDRGTQWAVFEPNGTELWANVRRTISDFLFNEFRSGALLGERPESAFFVKCDRSTMTQNDLDNGRLICLVGVAPLKPAEFVIFRIGQWTAESKA